MLDLPLVADQQLVGVLNFATNEIEHFTDEHQEIAAELAAQLALALRQARLFAQLLARREQLRALSLRLVEVQEAERRFVARELHDEIGQLLTGLKLQLDLCRPQTSGDGRAALTNALDLVGELMQRVRKLSLDLRPHILDDLGLLPALDWHFRLYGQQTGIRVHFRHSLPEERPPSELETAVFRIAQEALTNVARHAGVKEAQVRVWSTTESLGLQVEDAGVGFDPGKVQGGVSSGVAGMRERAALLGGEFTLESAKGKGTCITVEFPLPSRASNPTFASPLPA